MANSYIPTTDAGKLYWAKNFAEQIAQGPASYGLTTAQVTQYTTLVDAYETAYAAATAPETRGGATVLAKNTARKELVAMSRNLAMIVTNHPGVTDQMRYDLGLTVPDRNPTPVPPPDHAPVLDVVSVSGRSVSIRLHDGSMTRRGKPEGVQGASVMRFVGQTPPADLNQWALAGSTTRTSMVVEFGADVEPGSKVWLAAFWYNRRAQRGPACHPVSTHIQYGGVTKAA